MNRRDRKSTIVLSAALSATLLTLCTLPLEAQGSVYAEAGVSWSAGTIGNGGIHCGDTGTEMIKASFSATDCKGGPNFAGFNGGIGEWESEYLMGASARAFKGSLGAESWVSWFINKKDDFQNTPYNPTTAGGNATARWDDRARFSPIGPASSGFLSFMDITFRVTGGTEANVNLEYFYPGLGNVNAGTAYSRVSLNGGTQGNSFNAFQNIAYGLTTAASPPMPEYHTLRVGVTGFVSNPFVILLGTQTLIDMRPFFPMKTFTGGLETLFNHTLAPVSYSLWDDQGMDVTSSYAVTFDNGLEFATQQSVVPEPASVVLMAAGLCGLFAARRRIRRRM